MRAVVRRAINNPVVSRRAVCRRARIVRDRAGRQYAAADCPERGGWRQRREKRSSRRRRL